MVLHSAGCDSGTQRVPAILHTPALPRLQYLRLEVETSQKMQLFSRMCRHALLTIVQCTCARRCADVPCSNIRAHLALNVQLSHAQALRVSNQLLKLGGAQQAQHL